MELVFILATLLLLDIFDPLLGSLDIIPGVKANSFYFSIDDVADEFLELFQFFVNLGVFSLGLLGFLIETCHLGVDLFEGCFEIIDGLKLIFQLIEVFEEFAV